APHRVDEVGEMPQFRRFAAEFFDHSLLIIIRNSPGQIAAFALDDLAHAFAAIAVHASRAAATGQAAHLEDKQDIAVIEHGHLSVSRFAVIHVADSAADAEDFRSQRGFAEGPPALVHFVNALVADIPATSVP